MGELLLPAEGQRRPGMRLGEVHSPRTLQPRGETATPLLSISDTFAEVIGEAAVKVQGRTAHAQTGNLYFGAK